MNSHRHSRRHADQHTDPINHERPPVPASVDEQLRRLRDHEIDAAGHNRQDHDQFSRDPWEAIHGIRRGDTAGGDLVCDHAADAHGDRHPVHAVLRAPAVEGISGGGVEGAEAEGPESHFGRWDEISWGLARGERMGDCLPFNPPFLLASVTTM